MVEEKEITTRVILTSIADNEPNVASSKTEHPESDNDIDMADKEPPFFTVKIDQQASDDKIVMADNQSDIAKDSADQVINTDNT